MSACARIYIAPLYIPHYCVLLLLSNVIYGNFLFWFQGKIYLYQVYGYVDG